jgi:predicted PurR-regulated permease PerM
MTLQKQTGFWVAALLGLIFILWLFQTILLPFIAGFVLAYFLDPVADRLEKIGLPRIAATAIILLVAILLLVLAAVMVVPVVVDQSAKLATEMPTLVHAIVDKFNAWAPAQFKEMLANSGNDFQNQIGDYAGKAILWLVGLLTSLWSGGQALVSVMYLLADWDHLVAKIDGWLPRDHQQEIRSIARDIDRAMAGFIRGQGTVCLILGTFYAVCLSLVGLKSGVAIGFAAGLLSFIPFVGALIGGIMAIGVGLVQFWPNEIQVLAVVAVFAIGQFLEGNFLSPRLVGGSIGLHPVWMMFALLAFSYVFGFMGLLLAVPLAAATGVFVRYGLNRYLNSNLYKGVGD